MSDDLISRQDTLNIIDAESWEYIDYLQKDIGGNYDCHISIFTDNIRERINDMPSITPTQNCVGNALGALDCISRQAVNTLVDELARAISDERCCMSRGRSTATIMQDILDLPSVNPQEPKSILEDIKAEINEGIENYKNKDKAVMFGFMCALYIINKHIEGWDKV